MAAFAHRRPLLNPDRGTPREIVTPEGTPIVFRVANAGDRLGAFLLDSLIQLAAIAILFLLAFGASGFRFTDFGLLWTLLLIAVFLIQNFYFIAFEMGSRGQTPGKRAIGIRVMDAQGGPLTSDAIVVRNLMRNLEVYLPLQALAQPQLVSAGGQGWVYLLSLVWMLVLAGLPLFNKWRLRPGDLVAGTLVVMAPKPVLLEDIGAKAIAPAAQQTARFMFTDDQLDVYGIYELQVLEDLLRKQTGRDDRQTLNAVAERITKKLEWGDTLRSRDIVPFLEAFYAALRARLERRMLFGRRKEDKHDA